MATVHILCGKVGCGKSTYAKHLKEKYNAVILSYDDLLLKLSEGCLGDKHDDVVRRCASYFYQLADQLIAMDLDVILDFGHWSKAERVAAKEYFSARNIQSKLYYIKIEEEKRIRQLDERNEKLKASKTRVYIIHEALRQFLDDKFEEPTQEEVTVLVN